MPAIVSAGAHLTYTIRYSNTGNANATDVVIRDTFPNNTSFSREDGSPPVIGTPIAGGREWNIPFLAGLGGNGIITLTLDVASPQDPGTVLTNVVAISSSEIIDPVSFTATNVITSVPVLNITKTADPSPVASGSGLVYTITFSNTGNAPATNVVITDTLDSRVTFDSASDGGVLNGNLVTWNIPTLPADQVNYTVSLTVGVAPMLPDNSLLINNVQISAGDVQDSALLTTLVQAPALAITKIISPTTDFIRAGDDIAYTIIYTNTGPITITFPSGILITDTFPVSITNIVSDSVEATFQSASPPDLVWFDAEVPPHGGGIITITGQVITQPWASTGGRITNDVIVAGNGYSATHSVGIDGQPGLPFTFTLVALPSTTPVGTNVMIGATATDAYGNDVLEGTPITLTTSLIGSRINGTTAPVTLNSSNGQVSAVLSSTVAGTTTVSAQIAGASGTLIRTAVVTFTPGAPIALLMQATSPQTAGVSFPITITAVDAFGNRVTTLSEPLTISDTTGSITPVTGNLVSGQATPNATVFIATSPLSDTITASGTVTGSVQVRILPNIATNLALQAQPNTLRICETAHLTATVTDAFGNAIPDRAVTLTTAPPGLVTPSPFAGTTNTAGIMTSTLAADAQGTASIFAISGALNDSTSVTVNAPPIPTSLSLTITPNPLATGGNTAAVRATVTDCKGPSAGQVITFTVSDPSLAFFASNPINATTDSTGVATVTLTSNSIPQDGTVTITGTTGSLTQTSVVTLQTAVLTITKAANPLSGTEVRPGQSLIYTLRVTNTGTGPASGVVITDVLPTSVAFGSCTYPSGANCTTVSGVTRVTTPTLAPGQALVATLGVTVTSTTSGTIISNSASSRSAQTGLITSNIVAHPVTTATVALYLPIVLKESAAPQPDLIGSFSLNPPNPSAGQPVVVTVVITNVGNAPTGDGFWVDFYINPVPAPTVGNQRWDVLGSTVSPKQGIAWAIPTPGLAPGARIILTSNGVGGLAPSAPQTVWSGGFVSGTKDLYIYM